MIFRKFLKSISIILSTILISAASVSISHAHNHTTKWEKINELKKEIKGIGFTILKNTPTSHFMYIDAMKYNI